MIDTERLIRKAAAYGIDVAPVVRKLDEYAALLVEYNQKVNLTAITDAEGIEDRHFIDSLLLAARPEVCGRMVDVGTGAGFPGIVAKLFRPELDLTLMEPTGKRVDFLKYACSALGVEAEFAKERAEEAARKQWRESFDVATARARAGAALPVLAEYCLPLLRRGGVFIAMKGSGADEEIDAAQGAVAKLGGKYAGRQDVTLPVGSARTLILYEKISQTPPVYPRIGGNIAKAPLK